MTGLDLQDNSHSNPSSGDEDGMSAVPPERKAITRPVVKLKVSVWLANENHEIPAFMLADRLKLDASVVGVKSMCAREDNGLLLLEVEGFTSSLKVQGSTVQLLLPEWAVTKTSKGDGKPPK